MLYNHYRGIELKGFYTVSEACKYLGLDADKLRYICVSERIIPFSVRSDELGIGVEQIHYIKKELDEIQFRAELHRNDNPWA